MMSPAGTEAHVVEFDILDKKPLFANVQADEIASWKPTVLLTG